MSRSLWAWAKGCELVGAAARGVRRLGTLEGRETLEAERLVRTQATPVALAWVATAVMLMLALSPAVALGKSANRSGRAPAGRAAHGPSLTPVTQAERSSDSPPPGGIRSRTRQVELLTFGSGYASAHGSAAVRALQRRLAGLGYPSGPIDGRFGPLTKAAVIRFQIAHGLRADGIDGPLTMAALASAKLALGPGEGYITGGSRLVRALQRHLVAAGFRPGPIDGRYGPLTERAVVAFQRTHHLRANGIAGPQTLTDLQRHPQRQVRSRPRPRTTPHLTHHPARPLRTPATKVHPQKVGHRTGHSTGSSLVPWLIVVAFLALAMLAGLVWHGRRRHDHDWPAATADPNSDGKEATADPDGVAAGPVPQTRPLASESSEPRRDTATIPSVVPRLNHVGESVPPPPGAGAFKLARVLAQAGNIVGAVDALGRADQRGHPTAAFELGVLLEQEGDREGAIQAFREAERRGHGDAALSLGVLLFRGGDVAGAEAAFRRADERGDPDAACNLGVLLEQHGDVAGARLAYQRADQRGHAVGAWNLGSLLEQQGDPAGAKEAYQRADERGYAAAACNLGLLLKEEGDRVGARQALERAGAHGPPEIAEVADSALRELRSIEDHGVT
ncbi:MAG: peptidoglycan-binding protein [Solirubrobacterales bacterium]|nr:peptidoglycan-binding protein [Solirubrobacterales bacterium]